MNIVQQEKIASCEEGNRRKIWNENIVTCKSETWNSTMHKKGCNTKKDATWKDYYTKKCIMEIVQYEKVAT